MGGSLCARRSTTLESKQSEPALFEERRKHEPKEVKNIESKATTAPLPTKSWTARLNEIPLNADAKPFNVGGPRGPRRYEPTKRSTLRDDQTVKTLVSELSGPERHAKSDIGLISADEEDPEWMQYLSKKLQNQRAAKLSAAGPACLHSGNDFKRKPYSGGNRPVADYMRSNHVGSEASTVDIKVPNSCGAAPGSSLVFHTEEYLKILREGQSAKANGASASLKSHGPQSMKNGPLSSKGKLVAGKLEGSLKIRWLPGEANSDRPGPVPGLLMPSMTASSLANKRATLLKAAAAVENGPEVHVPTTTQDDLVIEDTLLEQDLSDLVYWSETDCVSCKKSPSAHALGRQLRTSKSMCPSYVMQDLSFDLDRAVGKLLFRLQRFTDNHRAFRPELNLHRRYVIGLKEVARRCKQNRFECLIVAPDIEESTEFGGLDDRMRELLASAYKNNLPVIFALSRALMGQALGKAVNISVLAVLDTTGARELMAECIRLAHECRQAWLSRAPY